MKKKKLVTIKFDTARTIADFMLLQRTVRELKQIPQFNYTIQFFARSMITGLRVLYLKDGLEELKDLIGEDPKGVEASFKQLLKASATFSLREEKRQERKETEMIQELEGVLEFLNQI